jgi:hypothetical protein
MSGNVFRAVAAIALFALVGIGGCADGAEPPSGTVLGNGTVQLRLIGVDIAKANAVFAPAVLLFCGLPPGIDPAEFNVGGDKEYTLSESFDGRTFNDVYITGSLTTAPYGPPLDPSSGIIPPPGPGLTNGVVWYFPLTPNPVYYRVKMRVQGATEFIISNIAKINAVPGAGGAGFVLTQPAASSIVDPNIKYAWGTSATARTYLLINWDMRLYLFDPTRFLPIIDSVIEVGTPNWSVGARNAFFFNQGHTPLKSGNWPYLVTVFGVDATGFGAESTPNVSYRTKP